ncbi:glycoside hydrolase family 16 protein [Pedobacter sp. UBA5917]|uniref:glycoside hydrolase family 16 protein n=1 Tax=Pedobacter sp. UBA5917 TaxID=1947061 RepID=UPI0025F58BD2|nr:glycoside hydrolase family 16 protein [Pedobacter sp. UBA5917]
MLFFWPVIINSGFVLKRAANETEDYRLVWADEFNNNGAPDAKNWRFEYGFVRNNELQWYQNENAYCKNGLLIIEARRETKANPWYKKDSKSWRNQPEYIKYTSSSINTQGLHAWQYGRFIMRGRINTAAGLWPAWWTLGVKNEWPANGEIDMMEYYQDKLLANIACADKDGKAEWYSKNLAVSALGGKKWADQFHIWRMDWDEEHIALYVDDQLINEVKLSQLQNKDSKAENPFKQPHYMLFDLALGGMNGGEVKASTPFPNQLEIDYVRVYQRPKK